MATPSDLQALIGKAGALRAAAGHSATGVRACRRAVNSSRARALRAAVLTRSLRCASGCGFRAAP